jgi:hypothetical protein
VQHGVTPLDNEIVKAATANQVAAGASDAAGQLRLNIGGQGVRCEVVEAHGAFGSALVTWPSAPAAMPDKKSAAAKALGLP